MLSALADIFKTYRLTIAIILLAVTIGGSIYFSIAALESGADLSIATVTKSFFENVLNLAILPIAIFIAVGVLLRLVIFCIAFFRSFWPPKARVFEIIRRK